MNPSLRDRLTVDGGWASFPGWSLVEVSGRDAERFLHSQLTADIKALHGRDSACFALLDRSARLQAFGLVDRHGEGFRLLVPESVRDLCMQRLLQHVIADDVSFSHVAMPTMRVVLGRGPGEIAATVDPKHSMALEIFGHHGVISWSGAAPQIEPIDDADLESLRIVSGFPRWGVEANAKQLINETVLVDTAVSHTKGCYLGQETVNKIRSHRGARSAPKLLEVEGGSLSLGLLVGQSFEVGGRHAGKVHAATAWGDATLLAVSLRRELRVDGSRLCCRFTDRELAATVRSSPLIQAPTAAASADALLQRAVACFAADSEDEAVSLLERAIEVCPGHVDAHESLGVIYRRRAQHDLAIRTFEGLLAVDPDAHMAHTNLSLVYNQLGRIDEAEEHLALAARLQMRAAQREEKAHELDAHEQALHRQELERREAMFRQVLEIDPDDPLANFSLGELFVETARFKDAVDHLRRALAHDSGHSAAYLSLGRAWEGAGQPDKAAKAYTEGIAVAAAKGALMTANQMQQRLAELSESVA